ncbi:MAG: hypothetical protein KF819_17240 [Labilithrix sp.]|nr:hypothetical protein [Labilithrix sp.]
MSASPFVHTEVPPERSSTAPLAVDHTGSISLQPPFGGGWASKIPAGWLGMSGYLIAGVLLGLVLIVALSLTRSEPAAASAAPNTVTDNVVHLGARDIGESCWRSAATRERARITVSMEVGLDGKVRNAIATGETREMRGCVEAHVRGWEFLPQATPSMMVLPFEIHPR